MADEEAREVARTPLWREMSVLAAVRGVRQRGLRWSASVALSILRMKWAARHATKVGWGRLYGRAIIRNDGGRLDIEDGVILLGSLIPIDIICNPDAYLRIGERTVINYGSSIASTGRVEIGRNCQIGQYVVVMDSEQHTLEDHKGAAPPPDPVVIEDDVWLGIRVTVLPGSHIGRGSVIGAHALVRGEIPPYSLAVGVPAKVVRTLGPGHPAGAP